MNLPVPSILNFRDVGKTINALSGKKSANSSPSSHWAKTNVASRILSEGLIFRSARPDAATRADRDRLVGEYRITTIVDLRTKTEHIEQAKKRDAKARALAASPEALDISDEIPAGAIQIPGISYRNINFNGKAYSKTLLAQLTWPQYLKLIGLMGVGRRLDAIYIIGFNVMREKGLVGLGCDSVDACTAEVREFFDVMSEGNPTLVHCTQGKDRTGLTILLLLLLLGVSLAAAEKDYMMSQEELVPEREERVKEIERIGLPASFADCDAGFVKAVDEHIRVKHGGIEKYLVHCGVSEDTQRRMRSRYLEV